MAAETLGEIDKLAGFPHPREIARLYGHAERDQAFLAALTSGRLHHGWLLGGPEGIGKASFAYRAARFLLARGDPRERAKAAASLDTAEDDPGARLVVAQSHPDLHILRRQLNKDGKAFTSEIPVDAVRRLIDRFTNSASGGGYRICIVDCAEDLNRSGANALLKLLEEPPRDALFLIVSHAPGRLLPTIRSRCRTLAFQPLGEADLRAALGETAERAELEVDAETIAAAASMAKGSVRRGLTLLDPATLKLADALRTRLDRLPEIDPGALLSLAEDLAGKQGEAAFGRFVEIVEDWLSATIHAQAAQGPARLAPLAEVWDKLGRAAREADAYNLDRRPLVLTLFHDLSEAVSRSRAA